VGSEATYAVHLRFIGKLLVDFLFVVIELFNRCFSFDTIHAFDKRTDGRTDRLYRGSIIVAAR